VLNARRVSIIDSLKAPMTDPRNVAHDKKVHQEKKHHGEEIAPEAVHAPQPGKKPHLKDDESKVTPADDESGT
jgi:hypothetical protein